MISQTAPTQTQKRSNEPPAGFKDNAYVAFYNDYDLSELLFKNPVFESGFLPLEPEDEQEAHSHARSVRPAETTTTPATSNTATTPPPTATVAAEKPDQPKSAMRAGPKAKVAERRPSFIEVSTPKMHDHAESAHKEAHHAHRRHSSESHVPMSWWPEDEMTAQLSWEERDDDPADLEEEIMEEEMWAGGFYDL